MALVGHVFSLPLVVPLGAVKVRVLEHGLARDVGPHRLWLVNPTEGKSLVQRWPSHRHYHALTYFQIVATWCINNRATIDGLGTSAWDGRIVI